MGAGQGKNKRVRNTNTTASMISGIYYDGTGQKIENVHDSDSCLGDFCVIHNPSNHAMKDFPTHWRDDRKIMERMCPHGIGHPDPDQLDFIERTRGAEAARIESVHGCDGCCATEQMAETNLEEVSKLRF